MYCIPPGGHISKLPHEDILRYEEILRIIRVGVKLGISKVRITGGEPLIRKGIREFLKELGSIKELSDISLTTNGVLLKDHIESLRASGIRRLNISLDTLNPEKFKLITGHDHFRQVWEGISDAYRAGFSPIKLNVVALNGINDDEFSDMAKLIFDYPFHIRFIEYMPIGNTHLNDDRQILAPEIIRRLSAFFELIPIEKEKYDGPAERYRINGAKGELGFIRPISRHFCSQCNRMRLTANGKLRPCLLSDQESDIRDALRRECSDSEIETILLNAARHKPSEHNLNKKISEQINRQMCAIGG